MGLFVIRLFVIIGGDGVPLPEGDDCEVVHGQSNENVDRNTTLYSTV